MKVVANNQVYHNSTIVKKSRFECYIKKVNNLLEINNFLATYSDPNATHNCYAYVVGNQQQIRKKSDDGEPSNTAGKPLLDLIIRHNFTNIIILVVRYFGGIKLGVGLLTRSYLNAAKLTLETIPVQEFVPLSLFCFTTLLINQPQILAFFKKNQAIIKKLEVDNEKIYCEVELPKNNQFVEWCFQNKITLNPISKR